METKKPLEKGMIIGLFLVGLGALLMLQTLGIVPHMWDMTVGFAFLGGAAAFLAVWINNNRNWWAFFPAGALAGIGLVILTETFFPRFDVGGPLFLGLLGAAFVAVYANDKQNLWAVIPGGALLTLALVAGADQLLPWFDGGALFFTGLAATFAGLYYLAPNRPRWAWALIVAAALGALAVLIAAASMMKYLFPIVLIGLGVFLLRDRLFTHNSQ